MEEQSGAENWPLWDTIGNVKIFDLAFIRPSVTSCKWREIHEEQEDYPNPSTSLASIADRCIDLQMTYKRKW